MKNGKKRPPAQGGKSQGKLNTEKHLISGAIVE